jgi:hypothetical protein
MIAISSNLQNRMSALNAALFPALPRGAYPKAPRLRRSGFCIHSLRQNAAHLTSRQSTILKQFPIPLRYYFNLTIYYFDGGLIINSIHRYRQH